MKLVPDLVNANKAKSSCSHFQLNYIPFERIDRYIHSELISRVHSDHSFFPFLADSQVTFHRYGNMASP